MPETRALYSGERPNCGHGQDVPDALTDTELLILARRGLLIAKRLPWAVEVRITPQGLNAVWDRAHESIRHLRPDADHLARVGAAVAEALKVWATGGREVFCSSATEEAA